MGSERGLSSSMIASERFISGPWESSEVKTSKSFERFTFQKEVYIHKFSKVKTKKRESRPSAFSIHKQKEPCVSQVSRETQWTLLHSVKRQS